MTLCLFFSGITLYGQDIPGLFQQSPEIFFSFQIQSREEIRQLTNIISIDKVADNTVWAYANIRQYLNFQKLGYTVTLLPHPGDGAGAEMTSDMALGPKTTWDSYPTYTGYENLMVQFATTYPALCHLDTLATLASGRRLLVLKISDNASTDEGEPEFFYSSSIHGDETTGYVLMLHLADYLLSNYGTNTEATDLVNNLEIFICPLANPDGTYYGGNNSVSGARRYNFNGVDLNRNYPDPQDGQHPDGNATQPETVAFMTFAQQRHLVSGANFHGGAEVVNYPWDTWSMLHADDAWFQYISREYADTVHLHSPSGYMNFMNNGVTNGYAWYEVNGGRQDYMNYYHHCREITIEISNTKLLPSNLLLAHWDYNRRSFLLWLKEAKYGIHGTITNQLTGDPVLAKVMITGYDTNGSEVYSSAGVGDYHRPVKAGTYTLECSAPCYQTQIIPNVTVADHASVTLNIQLVPGIGVTTAAVSAITETTATAGGTVICENGSAITARGVCWGTAANPVVSGQHTTNGTGLGSFSSQITGLSPNTTYHVRAYATNITATGYGEDVQFTTACLPLANLPWSEGFSISGQTPSCWSQVDNIGNDQGWQFGVITGESPIPLLTGNYAYLNSDAYGGGSTQNADLVSPRFNLSAYSGVTLQFSHYFKSYTGSSGRVSYSINDGATWTSLQQFTTNSATNPVIFSQTIAALAGQSQVRFKWNYTGSFAWYWAVDDIHLSGTCSSFSPVGVSISASANPVNAGTSVTFTAAPVNGGATPSFLWRVNGAPAGINNPVLVYVPVHGDVVTCQLTSALPCTTGNPATSNPVTMTVNTILPLVELQNQSFADARCFNATQSILVAGNGTLFTVNPGGHATMIAGQNIVYLPGTSVGPGGYMNGYISPSGPFCPVPPPPATPIIAGDEEKSVCSKTPVVKIYPNPTFGNFMVEVTGIESAEVIRAEIYGLHGEKVQSAFFTGGRKQNFSLAGKPAGMYFILVITEHGTCTGMIVINQ